MSLVASLLQRSTQLIPFIPRSESNGNSILGTVDAPQLPSYIQPEHMLGRRQEPAGWTDPRGPAPISGNTRHYDFTITRQFLSPDGVNKSMLLVNGEFPGPTIEANWGDTIKVKVTNKITAPEEGTTLHWHGLFQKGTQWEDGVPGVSQCPVAPSESFTYEFQASQYGTTWYHSHVQAQYMDGVFGALVVHGPAPKKYDVDVGPILLTDWAHHPYFDHLIGIFSQPPYALDADNNLINGKMPYNCSLAEDKTQCRSNPGNIAKFKFQNGKTHLLRLINAGRQGNQKFSIDGHDLEIIANDFVPIKPYTTKVVTLAVGQRTDVLVRGKPDPRASYWMRADLDANCLNLTSTAPNATAGVYYPRADTNRVPKTSKPTVWTSNRCMNDPIKKTQPLFPKSVAKPDVIQTMDLRIAANETGYLLFTVNNSTGDVNFNEPVFPQAVAGNTNFPPHRNIYNFNDAKHVRVILRNYNEYVHPMHLHGHNFQVLAEGTGDWDGKITNSENPQMRDTHTMPPGTEDVPVYTVIQWEANNPGIWPFHCHLLIHSNPGLVVNILEQPQLLRNTKIPPKIAETCKKWDAWTKKNTVNQIGSGFKERAKV